MISNGYELHYKHNLKTKFFFVGIWNTFFGYLVFYLLDTLFSPFFVKRYIAYMSAMTFGQIISITNAYIFHKHMTFKSNAKGKEMIKEFLRFNMTYIATYSISLILLPFFVEIFHITPKLSAAVVIFICAIISYLGHSRFSFKQLGDQDKN